MQDYSQSGEQAAILDAFEGAAPGLFLDIGGWNPLVFSNTRALYEVGWGGLIIEPSPGPMQTLLDAYGDDRRIKLLQACAAVRLGIQTLQVTDDAVSTSNPEEYERWKGIAKFRGSLMVPAITLEQIADQFGGFDFWNIDAEGHSANLFLHMLHIGHFPRCVCVEHDSRTTELLGAATAAGYRATLVNQTNLVVVRG